MDFDVREQLENLAEEKYRLFSSSLTPGKNNILGVRVPKLRKLAKTILKDDWHGYLLRAMETSKEASEEETMEEVMLQGLVIGGCKAEIEEKLKLVAAFIPKIDCWPVCDTFCGELKIAATHHERVWEFIQPYLGSEKEYELRFGVVMLLHYLEPEYAPLAFAHFDQIKQEGYYVKMAIAWVLSMYYVKLPEITMEYLKKNQLDDFTFHKTLQKIRESLRVDDDTKQLMKSMRRK